jgi:phenylalanyl-tRNA synthetase beta chain
MEMAKVYLRDGDTYSEPLRLAAVLTGSASSEHWSGKPDLLSLYHVKGMVEGLLASLHLKDYMMQASDKPYLVPGECLSLILDGMECASCGRLNSRMAADFGIDTGTLKQDVWVIEIDVQGLIERTRDRKPEFSNLPRYPSVGRDLSFVIRSDVAWSEIRELITSVDRNLISSVSIFDQFRGKQIPEGCRSISLHLVLQDSEKTLTDERVDQLIASVIKRLTDTWQINMR